MKYKSSKRALAATFALWLALAALSGCASGEIEQVGGDDDASDDTQTMGDAGVDGDESDGEDADEDTYTPPPEPTPTLAPSGGGATVETSNHRIRLIVAPRGGARTLETPNHRIRLGAGQAQAGQER